MFHTLTRLPASQLLGATCALLCAFCPRAAAAQESTTVAVDAREEWTDTGIDLQQGDAVALRVEAAWSNVGEGAMLGPDGYHSTYPGTVLRDAPLASLIGKVGNETFAVGRGVDRDSPAEGRLYLSMNDLPGTYGDNRGRAVAVVRVTRKPGTATADPSAQGPTADGNIANEQGSATAVPSTPDPSTQGPTADGSLADAQASATAERPTAAPTADVAVALVPAAGELHRPGDWINLIATISNRGRDDATYVRIRGSAINAGIEKIRGACDALPCEIARVAAGASVTLQINAKLQQEGRYALQVEAKARQRDPIPANNTADSPGVAKWPSNSFWWYVAGAGVLLGAVTTQQLRKRYWRQRVRASARVDADQSPAVGPLTFPHPMLSVIARIDAGAATTGAVPTRMEDARHG